MASRVSSISSQEHDPAVLSGLSLVGKGRRSTSYRKLRIFFQAVSQLGAAWSALASTMRANCGLVAKDASVVGNQHDAHVVLVVHGLRLETIAVRQRQTGWSRPGCRT